jgi:hypothetical protein
MVPFQDSVLDITVRDLDVGTLNRNRFQEATVV